MHHGQVKPDIAAGLVALKQRIADAEIPPSQLDQTVNVAVWNIREFGRKPRKEASIHYIAEIIGQFDLVALVELRDNLSDLGKVLAILGPTWDAVYCDWMEDSGGNEERTAFVFDRRAVTFNGLAAEVDPGRTKEGEEYLAKLSFWRAPYMCSFRAGNFDFVALAMHARWGKSNKGRQGELQLLADWIKERFATDTVEDRDLLVMGDFNTPKLTDAMFGALTSGGLQIPDALRRLRYGKRVVEGSNLGDTARYDQILHLPTKAGRFTDHAGIVDFFGKGDAIKELFPTGNLTPEAFSYQLSDHFPIWIQIDVDIDGDRLEQIVKNSRK